MGWLKEMGYTFNPSDLDVVTCSAFIEIGTELQRLAELEREKDARRSSNRT